MFVVFTLLLVFINISVCVGEQIQTTTTTTKSYDLDVEGSDPIRIIEGEPLWSSTTPRSLFNHRSLNTYISNDRMSDNSEEITPGSLQEFLNKYNEKLKRKNNHRGNYMETVELVTKPSIETVSRLANIYVNQQIADEQPKSWDLLNYQKHHHPYDDKKGWVSMDPVPWSISKISKWHGSQKQQQQQQKPAYEQKPILYDPKPAYDQRPSYDSDEDYSDSYPKPWNKPYRPYDPVTIKPNGYEGYFVDKQATMRPVFSKPTAVFGHKVHVDYSNKLQQQHHHHHPQQQNQYKHDENCDPHESDEIITDGLPPNFPELETNRRRVGEVPPPNPHPFMGEGDWVLLSTTKGYKYPPQRQRALQINPQTIGTHRGVRLTVLPPLKDSKINMTTSHGGLLQVESTFQTVEQAKNQFLKKQKNKLRPKRKQKVKRQPNTNQNQQIKPVQTQKLQQVLTTPLTGTTKRNGPDASSVLAAVGAGMIPATMAMLVPMAMGGKRRRRDINNFNQKMNIRLPRGI